MKTINMCLEQEYFDKKNQLPRVYTWQKIIQLGLDAAKREEEKILFWKLQEDVKKKNGPNTKLGLVKIS